VPSNMGALGIHWFGYSHQGCHVPGLQESMGIAQLRRESFQLLLEKCVLSRLVMCSAWVPGVLPLWLLGSGPWRPCLEGWVLDVT